METHMDNRIVVALCFIAFALIAPVIWALGRRYGETEAEQNWLRRDAERQVKAAKIPTCSYNDPPPSPPANFTLFDKKVAARLKKSAKAKK